MGQLVTSGTMLQCSFGSAPVAMTVLPANKTLCGGMPAANIMDNVPMMNIMPFVMCSSLANPTVASATSAAMGVLTPMPCVPVIPGPWAPGAAKTLIGGKPAVDNTCKLNCAYSGVISVVNPAQVQTTVG